MQDTTGRTEAPAERQARPLTKSARFPSDIPDTYLDQEAGGADRDAFVRMSAGRQYDRHHHSEAERAREARRRSAEKRAKRSRKISAGVMTALGAVLLSAAILLFLFEYALFTDGIRAQYSATYDLMAIQQEQIRKKVEPLAKEAGYDANTVMRAIVPEEIMQFSHDRVEWIWRVVLYNDPSGQPVWNSEQAAAAIQKLAPGADAAAEAARVAEAIDESVMPIQTVADRLLLFLGNLISEKNIVLWVTLGFAVFLLGGVFFLFFPRYLLRKYVPYADLYFGVGLLGIGLIVEIVQMVLDRERVSKLMDVFSDQIERVLSACVAWIMDAMALCGLFALILGAAFIGVFFVRRYQIKHYTHHELSRHQF